MKDPVDKPTSKQLVKENKKNKNNKKNKHKNKGGQGKWDVYNYQADWGYDHREKFIEIMPTNKIPLKKDRRVIFPGLEIAKPVRPDGEPSGVRGSPRALLEANNVLKSNILYWNETLSSGVLPLDEVMVSLQREPVCFQKPIFLSMATVGDDLYWQLIENFVYTMVKFNLSSCSIVICVSDPNCMKMCRAALFPCYNYQERLLPLPSVMEQIAKVKLLYVPMALSKGVDVFMLDLDVGFLGDPKIMVGAFVGTPIVDILVQEDYIFIMNRTRAGWKQWFTEPLPNIGLFLCRGNNRTAKVFDIAWAKYLRMSSPIEKAQPGKDQNHVLDAMRIGRGTFALKYAYFSNYTAPLLDKLVLHHGTVMELGGELMESFLLRHHSLAVHTTCYEKSTKVMGLKAANAFWNPRYYDPLTPTLTKQLIFLDEHQLLEEVRALVWLAMSTRRSLIVPNILGPDHLAAKVRPYRGQVLWPGFRVTFLKRSAGRNELKVDVLEPSFYWRVNRDYDAVPAASFLYFDAAQDSLADVLRQLRAVASPRVILHPNALARSPALEQQRQREETELRQWADDSVGLFAAGFELVRQRYRQLPSLKTVRAEPLPLVREVFNGMRLCNAIFDPPRGNRTCFQICK